MVIAFHFSPPVGFPNLAQVQFPYTFVVTTSGSNITAIDNTGTVSYSGADTGAVLQSIHDNGTTPLSIYLTPGIYPFATKFAPTKNSVSLIGAGAGVTTLAANSGLTGNFSILDIEGGVSGTSKVMTVNTAKGDTGVTMLSGDALTFSGLQYALLLSELIKDTELNTKAGEIQKIQSISGGIVNFRDQVADTYLTADSGRLIGLNMLQGFNMSNMTIKSNAASGANNQAFVFMRFVQGISINNLEISNCNWGALQLSSCLNANINGCYMHDIAETVPPTPAHYGVVVHAASKNVVVNSCQFTTTRHGVTMGGQTGTNFNGVVRNVTITNCTSESADTAHYDTHQACEGIIFSSNTAYGGIGASGNAGAYGFQVRSPRTEVIGNSVLEAKTKGVYVFGQGNGALVNGNQINRIIQASGTGGDGVFMDSGITNVIIQGNRMQDLDGHPVTGTAANHNTLVNGNIFINHCVQTNDGAIRLSANNCIVTDNIFISGTNRPLQLQSGCANWTISNNDFTSMANSAPALSGGGHIVFNNQGYVSGVVISGQLNVNSASGIGLNFVTFVSGNTGNFVAANSGAFGPVGYFYVQASGGTTYKVPFMNS